MLPLVRALVCGLLLTFASFAPAASDSGPAAPVPSAIDPGVKAWQVFVVLGYLSVLGALGLGIVRYVRRGESGRGAGAADGQLRVLKSTRIAPGLTLTLVEVQGRPVLVAATASGTSIVELSRTVSP